MADRAREDFPRSVCRKLGESQSKDAKTNDLQSGWHSKCWRGVSLHSWMFASALARFADSCSTVRPRNPRQACLPLTVDGLSFRSVRCLLEHVCWDCCLYHFERERFFLCRLSQNPLHKAQHLKERTHPSKLIDSVTKARFSIRAILHAFSVDVAFFDLSRMFRRLCCWNWFSVFPHFW